VFEPSGGFGGLESLSAGTPHYRKMYIVYRYTKSQASFSARSFVAEFRKPSLDFIGIRLRERLNTELDE